MSYKLNSLLTSIFIIAIFSQISLVAKDVPVIKIDGKAPLIDGKLSEDCWNGHDFMSGFTQKDPNEGMPASNKIEIRYRYDNHALYIGARMYKDSPDDIIATTSRRDNTGNSERIIFSIDSYDDGRTAYTFGLTASGVRFDYYHSTDNEGDRDYSFNPVWIGKVNIDSQGWTAEIKIPFSQLRFNDIEEQTWGINVNWWVPYLREDAYWIVVPKNETGWSSRMGKLTGIKGIKPSNRIELLPYISGNGIFDANIDQANPFAKETDFNGMAGLDFKMGIGPNYTIDATFNPDFGQVEADPAVVNLTAYETFFSEKRPFFTEGRKIIQGGGPNYFYSRRIGASPLGNPDPNGLADYTQTPDNTQILGAAKITGRSESGLSVGGLAAVTSREYSKIYFAANDSTAEVQSSPLTTFAVARVQQEFGENKSVAGIMLTGLKRELEEKSLLESQLAGQAVTGGADWNLRFKGGEYVFGGHLGFSHITGSKEALLNIQQYSARYMQRPDAGHMELDSNMESMTGLLGGLWFNRNAGEHWLFGYSMSFETPELEINDLGQLQSADDIDFNANVTYRETVPNDVFHAYNFRFAAFHQMNYGFESLKPGFSLNSNFTFLDRSSYYFNIWHNFEGYDDALTRGGPMMGIYSSSGLNTGFTSDWTQNIGWNTALSYQSSPSGTHAFSISGKFSLRTGGNLEFSIVPSFNKTVSTRQYITTMDNGREINYGKRYIFSAIDRHTISAQFRLNYAFTNDLTLEIYAEPFVSSGKYYDFGELSEPGSRQLRMYGEDGTQIIRNDDNSYTVTDGDEEFALSYSDFNYLSFRSNIVVRWEWLPGSTFYFVWQQNRSDYSYISNRVKAASLLDTFAADGINTLALKISYWIPVD